MAAVLGPVVRPIVVGVQRGQVGAVAAVVGRRRRGVSFVASGRRSVVCAASKSNRRPNQQPINEDCEDV